MAAAYAPVAAEPPPVAPATTALWQRVCAETRVPGYRFGTHRAVPPAVTLRRIRPLLARAGITRLADVTGLDWVGIPVYQAVRPNSCNLSVSQGKGLTRAQAKVSALMEALESFHAEEIRQPTVRATVGAMRRELAYDPYQLARSDPSYLCDETALDWVAATDLWTGTPSWVPKRLCDLDGRIVERRRVPLFQTSSNGLASGNTVGEALIHGLCEVVERDSLWRFAQSSPRPEQFVNPKSITSRLAQRLLGPFARAGISVWIADVSGPTGLPCFRVALDHSDAPILHLGSGCHPSRLTALLRALTEAAQSRATAIAGSRDDITREHYADPEHPVRPDAPRPFPTEARGDFRAAPTLTCPEPRGVLPELVRRVRAFTGMSPLVVDLWRPEFGIPVVFVIAPGLRVWHDG